MSALFGEDFGDGFTDAFACADDDGSFALEASVHVAGAFS